MDSYSSWRWRALYCTRSYLYNSMMFMMAFSWLIGTMYSSYCQAYYSTYGKERERCSSQSFFFSVVTSLPPVMGGIHILMLIWKLLHELYQYFLIYNAKFREKDALQVHKDATGASIFHTTQGMRFLEFFVASITLSSTFTALSWYEKHRVYVDISDNFASFSIIQFTAPFCLNHLGLPYQYTATLWYFSLLLWVVAAFAPQATWLAYTYVPFDLLIVFTAGFILVTSEACNEQHLRGKFGLFSRLASMKVGFSERGVSLPVAGDVASNLTLVNDRLDELDNHLSASGVKVWLGMIKKNMATGYRFEKRFAQMYEARLLCRALRGTLVELSESSFMDQEELREQKFAFSLMCMHLFAMLEVNRGRALALYSADETPEIFFTGKEGLIHLILYLLVVEAVDPHPVLSPGVVMVRCHMVQGAWYVSVTITRTIHDNVRLNSSVAGNEIIGINGGIVEKWHEGSITSRLAAKLAQRYLHTKLETKETISENLGVLFTEHAFTVEGIVPSIMGAEAHSDLLLEKQTWLFIIDDFNSRDLLKDYQLVRNLERINVPFETCKLDLLDNLEKRHNVAVVEEFTFLSYRSKFIKLLRRVALKVFILSDQSSGEMHSDFKARYGIEGRKIDGDISLHELLSIVHDTASTAEPRSLVHSQNYEI